MSGALTALGHVGELTHVALMPLPKYISFIRLRSAYEFRAPCAALMRFREARKRQQHFSIVDQVKEEIQYELMREFLDDLEYDLLYFTVHQKGN